MGQLSIFIDYLLYFKSYLRVLQFAKVSILGKSSYTYSMIDKFCHKNLLETKWVLIAMNTGTTLLMLVCPTVN